MARSLFGSAPMPSGNRLVTTTKNSSAVARSLRRRIATSRSRHTTMRAAASKLELDHAAVAQAGVLVRAVHHAAAALRVLAEQRARELRRRGVERGEWLVEQPDRRLPADAQARERRAPALALRELAHRLVARHAIVRQRLANLIDRRREPRERAARAQILGASELLLHRRRVPKVYNVPGVFLLEGLDVGAVPAHFARARREQPVQDPQQAGLAAAVRPRDAHQFAGRKPEREPAEERSSAALAFQIPRLQHGRIVAETATSS